MSDNKLKIRLVCQENDEYNELWATFDEKPKYFCRNVYGKPYWYYVCDPLGYCELDRAVENDKIFVVCSSDGKEQFESSNLTGADFPTFEAFAKKEWEKVKGNFPHYSVNSEAEFWSQTLGSGTTYSADKWLLTFMDIETYPEEIAMMHGYEENWVNCNHNKPIKKEIVHEFEYLGEKYMIAKVTYEHDVCHKQTINYWVTDREELDEYVGWNLFLADYFEGEPGPILPESDAVRFLVDGLKTIYKGKILSYVAPLWGYRDKFCEQKVSIVDAAKHLMKGNKNKNTLAEKIKNEKRKHTFFECDDPTILTKYPDLIRDTRVFI